ncbi:DUF6318 family protein [Actinomyces bowdenii]|uniref:DUF6318 family protein n=1 Tax=Actinomyces bowdenii TaxID=131109 RepID=UPI002444B546|nr:DUF6318 family protein [Actinomyces bowdenii]
MCVVLVVAPALGGCGGGGGGAAASAGPAVGASPVATASPGSSAGAPEPGAVGSGTGESEAPGAGVGADPSGGPVAELPAEQEASRRAALATALPERPAGMDENSPAGAIATAEYFVQLYPYVYATGDLEQWRAMSREDCVFCTSVIDNVTELHSKGGWRDPWVHTVTNTQYVEPGPGSDYSRIDVVFNRDATYTYDGSGNAPDVADANGGVVLMLAMKYENGRWVIREGEPA